MDWFRDVMDFHKAMGIPIGGLPDTELENDLKAKALSLMLEELHETIVACINNDLVETADGLVDLIYVTIGAAVTFGIDLRPIWSEVHAANMLKAGGPKREDGKQLKPQNWSPPQLNGILDKQISLLEYYSNVSHPSRKG